MGIKSLPLRVCLTAVAGLPFGFTTPLAAQQTLFHACYVPDVGAVYMIKISGLPEGCLSDSHVEISWSDGSAAAIPDGSISTAKLAAPPQLVQTDIGRVNNVGTTIVDLGSITITAKRSGTVLVAFSGELHLSGIDASARVSIQTSPGFVVLGEQWLAAVPAHSDTFWSFPFAVIGTEAILAGEHTYRARAMADSLAQQVDLDNMRLIALFIPN